MKRTLIFIIALLAVTVVPSMAACGGASYWPHDFVRPTIDITYYVSNAAVNGSNVVGNDANACTSQGTACLTVAGALAKSTPTVVNINPSGTPYVAATFTSASIAGATIQTDQTLVAAQGKAVLQSTAGQSRVVNVSASNVTLNDLVLDATGLTSANGVSIQGVTGVAINRCDVKNIATSGQHGFQMSGGGGAATLDKCTVTLANGNSSGTNFSAVTGANCSLTIKGATATGINSGTTWTAAVNTTLLRYGASSDGTRNALTTLNYGIRFPAATTTTGDLENIDFKTTTLPAIYDNSSTTATVTNLTVQSNTFTSIPSSTSCITLFGSYTSPVIAYNASTSATYFLQTSSVGVASPIVHDNTITQTSDIREPILIQMASGQPQVYNNTISTDTTNHVIEVATDGTILQTSQTTASATPVNLGDISGRVWAAQTFTYVASTASLNSQKLACLRVQMKKTGAPSGGVTCYLFNDSAGSPGTLVATSEYTMPGAGQSSSAQWVEFWFPTQPTLSYSTAYWIVLKYGGTVDGSNYVTLTGATAGTTAKVAADSAGSPGAWSADAGPVMFQVRSGAYEITNPLIHDNKITVTSGAGPHCCFVGTAQGGKIYNNQIYGGGICVLYKLTDGSGSNTAIAYDNLIWDNLGSQQALRDKGSRSVMFLHNSVVETATSETCVTLDNDFEPTFTPQYNGQASQNAVVENNVLYSTSPSGSSPVYIVGGTSEAQPTCSNPTINYNNIYIGANTIAATDNRSGSRVTVTTFPSWQALGFDLFGKNVDPVLANEVNPSVPINFRPPYNSPALAMGTNLSGVISPYNDYLGASYIAASPTVGALNALFRTTTTARSPTSARLSTSGRVQTTTRTNISSH